MMKLLREIDAIGLPDDYLFARVRSRRAALGIGGSETLAGSADPHQELRREYAWVYTRLNRRLRRSLLAFFEYYELRNLVIALRYLAAGDPAAVEMQLRFSLLQPQLVKILSAAEQMTPLVALLEEQLADSYPFIGDLTKEYLRQGPGGLEQALLGGYLQLARGYRSCRPLSVYLIYLLDMRNLLVLYKHLYWQVPAAPPLVAGGEFDLAVYEKIWETRDIESLWKLVQKLTGRGGSLELSGMEDMLFAGLTTRLRREGQDPLQPGLVLDYLWQCRLASRSRGLRLADSGILQEVPLVEAG